MSKSRAVFIGSNAYPFLIRYWFELFTQKWQDEVDRVYFAISEPVHPTTWPWLKKLLTSHKKIHVIETKSDWPESINTGVRQVQEDLMFIAHDDTLIFKPGFLEGHFNLLEQEDKVITPVKNIFTPTQTVSEIMAQRFPSQVPINVPETGETAFSFYCFAMFIKTALFQKTRQDFGEWHVEIGDHCPELDWTPLTEKWGADTNFKLMLDLLRAGATFRGIPTYELGFGHFPEPLRELKRIKKEGEGVFDGKAGYLHLQTMAYHIGGLYWDLGAREAVEQTRGGKVPALIENEAHNIGNIPFINIMTIRLAWIFEMMEVGDYSGIDRYYKHATMELNYVIDYLGIDRKLIDEYKKIFHNLIWATQTAKPTTNQK